MTRRGTDDLRAAASQAPIGPLAVMLAFAGVGFALWRAWVCDDAFITFRIVENFLSGHGPVFNIGERVQGFTHPLWFGVLCLAGCVLGLYPAAVLLGLLLTLGLFAALAVQARDSNRPNLRLLLSSAVLLSSRTFVEYQTSGLESSLMNLLVVILALAIFAEQREVKRTSQDPSARKGEGREGGGSPGVSTLPRSLPARVRGIPGRSKPLCISLLIALIVLNRADHALLCAPIGLWLLASAVRRRCWRRIGWLALGQTPVIAWAAFATIFYGTPIPNTAYAKVAFPFPQGAIQGAYYAWDFVRVEPLHGLLIAAVLVGGPIIVVRQRLVRRPAAPATAALLCGLWLQTLYVIYVGGDFMRGRFLDSILVVATLLAAELIDRVLQAAPAPRRLGPIVQSLTVMAVLLLCAWFSLYDSRPRVADYSLIQTNRGIADEWSWYAGPWDRHRFRESAVWPNPRSTEMAALGDAARRYSEHCGPITLIGGMIGVVSYHAGPLVSIVDSHGLTDAFIARCEAAPGSRVGHINYQIPVAYLAERQVLNMVPDFESRLHRLDCSMLKEARALPSDHPWLPEHRLRWQRMRTVICGDLFTADRWRLIWSFALPRRT